MIRAGHAAPASTHDEGDQELHQGGRQGHRQGDVEDGHLDPAELPRRADLRGDRPQPGRHRQVLHLDAVAHRRHRPRRDRRGGRCRATSTRFPDRPVNGRTLDVGGQYQWRRDGEYHLFNPETIHKLQHACRTQRLQGLQGVQRRSSTTRRSGCARCAACWSSSSAGQPIPHRGGRAGRGDREALQDRRDVLRLDQQGGARDAGHRDEPHRRQEQHRRGRRGSGALHAGRQRRLAAQRDQAGRVGPLRRHQRVPGQRRRAADQDGAGRQARRGRPAARAQGLSVDREGPPLDAGRRA